MPINVMTGANGNMSSQPQSFRTPADSSGNCATRKIGPSFETLSAQIEQLASMPTVESILQPLLSYLQQPFEQQDMQRIVDLISHDNSLAAQCLHMANSPLFGRWQSITTPRAAVAALGLQRMRDIVLSCVVLKLIPDDNSGCNPVVFWEHSLACAMLARRMAKRLGVRDPEEAYLAGLMHDLGLIVNLRMMRNDFHGALQRAQEERMSLFDVEESMWGFSHCDTGNLLASKWGLTSVVIDVIKHHHHNSQLSEYQPMIALIRLCDEVCRGNGLGYGFSEKLPDLCMHADLLNLMKDAWPAARHVQWPQFAVEMNNYLNDVRKLIAVLFRFN